MNGTTWTDYQCMFNCKISMREPDGKLLLFIRENGKLYDIDSVPEDKINTLIKRSLESNSNVLLQSVLDKEIERNYDLESNKIY